MVRRIPPALWLALPLAYFLYFYQLAAVGLMGPDEPRYAYIARAMATSGDWITPRLLGQPWYEKPALLYWMEGLGFRAGLNSELAPRLPMALMAFAFLVLFGWVLSREFGCRAAVFATAILGTSGGWMIASQVGTPDLPLAASYSAAMMLCIPWVRRRDAKLLPWVGALLGLAVFAKGPVALALAAPALVPWEGRSWAGLWTGFREFLQLRVVAPFLLVAAPWYLLCTWVNGKPFLQDFFWKHNFQRFVSTTAVGEHGQPVWYFGGILLLLLLPWTPLVPLLFRRALYRDPVHLFLLGWAVLWLVFFSISANKLSFYILPMIPAVAALLGLALEEVRDARLWLSACALLLVAFPIAAPLLPVGIASGISKASLPEFHWTWFLPLAVVSVILGFEERGRRVASVLSLCVAATVGTVLMKHSAAPGIDHLASARALLPALAPHRELICVEWVPRGMQHSLDYYFVTPLPKCEDSPRPLRLHQLEGQMPVVEQPKTAPRFGKY